MSCCNAELVSVLADWLHECSFCILSCGLECVLQRVEIIEKNVLFTFFLKKCVTVSARYDLADGYDNQWAVIEMLYNGRIQAFTDVTVTHQIPHYSGVVLRAFVGVGTPDHNIFTTTGNCGRMFMDVHAVFWCVQTECVRLIPGCAYRVSMHPD